MLYITIPVRERLSLTTGDDRAEIWIESVDKDYGVSIGYCTAGEEEKIIVCAMTFDTFRGERMRCARDSIHMFGRLIKIELSEIRYAACKLGIEADRDVRIARAAA